VTELAACVCSADRLGRDKGGAGGGSASRASTNRTGADAYSSAVSSGGGSQADSATGMGMGADDGANGGHDGGDGLFGGSGGGGIFGGSGGGMTGGSDAAAAAGEDGEQSEVDAWQAGFEAGQEAAAWARLPSGSFNGDAQDFVVRLPVKVRAAWYVIAWYDGIAVCCALQPGVAAASGRPQARGLRHWTCCRAMWCWEVTPATASGTKLLI